MKVALRATPGLLQGTGDLSFLSVTNMGKQRLVYGQRWSTGYGHPSKGWGGPGSHELVLWRGREAVVSG